MARASFKRKSVRANVESPRGATCVVYGAFHATQRRIFPGQRQERDKKQGQKEEGWLPREIPMSPPPKPSNTMSSPPPESGFRKFKASKYLSLNIISDQRSSFGVSRKKSEVSPEGPTSFANPTESVQPPPDLPRDPFGIARVHVPGHFLTLTPHLVSANIYDCPLLYDRIVSTSAGRMLDSFHGVCLVVWCILSLVLIVHAPFATTKILLGITLLGVSKEVEGAFLVAYVLWCILTIFVLGYLMTLLSPPVWRLTWLRQKFKIVSVFGTTMLYSVFAAILAPRPLHIMYLFARLVIIMGTLSSEAIYATVFLRMTPENFEIQHGSYGVVSIILFGFGGFGYLAQDVLRHYSVLYSVGSPQMLITTGIGEEGENEFGLTSLDMCTLFYWTSMQFMLVHSIGILTKGGAGHTTMISTRFKMCHA